MVVDTGDKFLVMDHNLVDNSCSEDQGVKSQQQGDMLAASSTDYSYMHPCTQYEQMFCGMETH